MKQYAFQKRPRNVMAVDHGHVVEESMDDIFASIQPLLTFYIGLSSIEAHHSTPVEMKKRLGIQMRDTTMKIDELLKKSVSLPDVIEEYGALLEKDKIIAANDRMAVKQKTGEGDIHLHDWIDEEVEYERRVHLLPDAIQDLDREIIPSKSDMAHESDSGIDRYMKLYQKRHGIIPDHYKKVYQMALSYAKKHDPYYAKLLQRYDQKIDSGFHTRPELTEMLGENVTEEMVHDPIPDIEVVIDPEIEEEKGAEFIEVDEEQKQIADSDADFMRFVSTLNPHDASIVTQILSSKLLKPDINRHGVATHMTKFANTAYAKVSRDASSQEVSDDIMYALLQHYYSSEEPYAVMKSAYRKNEIRMRQEKDAKLDKSKHLITTWEAALKNISDKATRDKTKSAKQQYEKVRDEFEAFKANAAGLQSSSSMSATTSSTHKP